MTNDPPPPPAASTKDSNAQPESQSTTATPNKESNNNGIKWVMGTTASALFIGSAVTNLITFTNNPQNKPTIDGIKQAIGLVSSADTASSVPTSSSSLSNQPQQPTKHVGQTTVSSYLTASDCTDIANGTLTNQNELIRGINSNPANTRNLTDKLEAQTKALVSNNATNSEMYRLCLEASKQQPR
jgi:hypothetical protein